MTYTVHTIESAPPASAEVLKGVKSSIGFVPNLFGVFAEVPALAKAYTTLSGLFEQTSLTPTERQTVLLTVSYENDCEYCVAAHSVIATMQKVDDGVVRAIRDGKPIADPKLEALRRFTAVIVSTRGRPTPADVEAFERAGYSHAHALEVVLGVGFKSLSNYTNHLADTPLDQAFAKAAWSKAA